MLIGKRIRAIRESKGLSQGEIERRTGVMRAAISRIEHCHVTPTVETLERFARALEVPLYQFFYEGKGRPAVLPEIRRDTVGDAVFGRKGRDAQRWEQFRRNLARMSESDRQLLLETAQRMAGVLGRPRWLPKRRPEKS